MRSVATCNKTVVFCTETEYIVTRCAVMGCIADSYNHTEIPAGMCRNSSASSYPFTSLSVVYGCKNMNASGLHFLLEPSRQQPKQSDNKPSVIQASTAAQSPVSPELLTGGH